MASERYFEILLARSVSHVFGAKYSLIAQQLTLPSGRIDLLIQHLDGTKHVIEVKKDKAKPESVDQVLRYVNDFRSHCDEPVKGWVVANEISERTSSHAKSKDVQTLAIPEKKLSRNYDGVRDNRERFARNPRRDGHPNWRRGSVVSKK